MYINSLEYPGISNVVKKLYWQIMFSSTLPMKGQLILIRYQTQ